MITLHGFGRIFDEGRGETKDLWAQWALEGLGLPYRVHALDHTGGELDGEAYSRISTRPWWSRRRKRVRRSLTGG